MSASALALPALAVVHATVDGAIHLDPWQLPDEVLRAVKAALSFANPAYLQAVRREKPTRGLAREIHGWTEVDPAGWGWELVLPRGMAGWLRQTLRQHGLTLALDTSGVADGVALPGLGLRQALRPYQAEAVAACVRGQQGLVVAPCGSGKTQLGCGVIARLGVSTLILVHTTDLLQQWVERIRDVLGIEAGVVGCGKRKAAPVTVAMVQTLARWSDGELIDLGRQFGCLIVDEFHHGANPTYLRLVGRLPCRHRFGLTATPERDDGLTPLLGWLCGPLLHRTDHEELLAAGHLVPAAIVQLRYPGAVQWDALGVRYTAARLQACGEELLAVLALREQVQGAVGAAEAERLCARLERREGELRAALRAVRRGYGWDGEEKPTPEWAWDALSLHVADDTVRNALVADAIADRLARGGTVLALATRVAHCAELVRLLARRGYHGVALTGQLGRTARSTALAELRAGALRFAAATSLADEGLDVPRLTAVVLVSPNRAAGRTVQRLGRVMRPAPGKPTPELIDVVDSAVGLLVGQARARLRAYRTVLGEVTARVVEAGQLTLPEASR